MTPPAQIERVENLAVIAELGHEFERANLDAAKRVHPSNGDCDRTDVERADAWITAGKDRHNDPNDHDMCNLAAMRHIVNATVSTAQDIVDLWGAA